MQSLQLDTYILDTLMPDLVGHDRQPSAFLVYLYLWRRTHGSSRSAERVSLNEIADGTGLSKRSVQEALGRLVRRKLLNVHRVGITAIPQYTVHRPWTR